MPCGYSEVLEKTEAQERAGSRNSYSSSCKLNSLRECECGWKSPVAKSDGYEQDRKNLCNVTVRAFVCLVLVFSVVFLLFDFSFVFSFSHSFILLLFLSSYLPENMSKVSVCV